MSHVRSLSGIPCVVTETPIPSSALTRASGVGAQLIGRKIHVDVAAYHASQGSGSITTDPSCLLIATPQRHDV
jgi:hypothetical protein